MMLTCVLNESLGFCCHGMNYVFNESLSDYCRCEVKIRFSSLLPTKKLLS